nr:hypothetical protein [uncultured Porphyromonas sp.]
MRRKHLLEEFLCVTRIAYRYWYWTRLGYLQVVRGQLAGSQQKRIG